MDNILEDLYYGKINPTERKILHNEEYQELRRKAMEYEKTLGLEFGKEDLVLYEKLLDTQTQIYQLWERDTFALGMRIGARIILAILTQPVVDV